MRATLFILAFCFVVLSNTATAQVESACLLTISSSKIATLDDTKVQSAIKSAVSTIAGDVEVVFHKGTNEAAVLLCPSDACDAMPNALEAVKLFKNATVGARFERYIIGARAGCSFNYACPWYWYKCRTRTSKGRNKCYCPSGSCWGK